MPKTSKKSPKSKKTTSKALKKAASKSVVNKVPKAPAREKLTDKALKKVVQKRRKKLWITLGTSILSGAILLLILEKYLAVYIIVAEVLVVSICLAEIAGANPKTRVKGYGIFSLASSLIMLTATIMIKVLSILDASSALSEEEMLSLIIYMLTFPLIFPATFYAVRGIRLARLTFGSKPFLWLNAIALIIKATTVVIFIAL